ncbi:peptidoglycan D,D-transpeptidase FtsI family protein [Xylocopilactobacillus apicola]|uniref:Penicillin-binding protein n=1 Tax=Xylocopilactobacillus apicola TaxID=2932184 RepID=A0AAU9D7Y1_9LACO|nr:penicillin-binding protein 2 [Xylocopilactobacillus apicola]BDR58496.1 penicillin-binding protein [Xylocopilactobacillus apicola]
MKNNKHLNNNQVQDKSRIPFRLNLLFFIVFILFAILVLKLGDVQLQHGKEHQSEIDQTKLLSITTPVQRGLIYDSRGNVLAGNQATNAITYTRGLSVTKSEMYKIAVKLAGFIDVEPENLSKWDRADYYLANDANNKSIKAQMPKNLLLDSKGNSLSSDQIEKNLMQFTMDKEITFSKEQEKEATIFKSMESAYQLSTVYIKYSGLTDHEIAKVNEHLLELPGISVGPYWIRENTTNPTIAGVLGNVTSNKQGLPAEQINSLLAQGYARNDSVGTSYLEQGYEDVLKGSKKVSQIELSTNNKILSQKTIYPGQMGGSLNLTINSQFQNDVSYVVKSVLESTVAGGYAGKNDGAYAVVMNPKTGAIYAMAGVDRDIKTGEVTYNPLGVINKAYVMGSAVKGAMVMGGLMSGAITTTDNSLPDSAVRLPGTRSKGSVYPEGTFSSLTAAQALEVSSNIYMMRLAMKESNAEYVPNVSMTADKNSFDRLRMYFNEFGLGVKTGIDLPGEITGLVGSSFNEQGSLLTGSLLDLSYGNYDSYTTLQMAQYISTIANNGYRMKPYIVQSIQQIENDGSKGPIVYNNAPKVLNRVNATQGDFDLVKTGLHNVVYGSGNNRVDGWRTGLAMAKLPFEVAAKTGTSESVSVDGQPVLNESLVTFAPVKDPQIAIAIVFPGLNNVSYQNLPTVPVPIQMANQIYALYSKYYPDDAN